MLVEGLEEGDETLEVWRSMEGVKHRNVIKGVQRVCPIHTEDRLCGVCI